MQTYLKTRSAWVQLAVFIAYLFGSLMIIGAIGAVLSSLISGVKLMDLQNLPASTAPTANKLTFLRGVLITQFISFLLPVYIFARSVDKRPGTYLGLTAPSNTGYWLIGITILLAALPLVEYTGMLNSKINFGKGINEWMHDKENDARAQIGFLLSRNTPFDLVMNIICVAVFAGVGEELIFRGVLQRLFINITKSPWAGILIAAFLFSFIHFQFFGFIPRFLLGILLGAIYWYSGSLWPAIVAHFLYDAFIIVLSYFNPKMVTDQDASMIDTSFLWVGALISAIIVGAMVWWMKKNSTNSYERVYAGDRLGNPDKDFTFNHGI